MKKHNVLFLIVMFMLNGSISIAQNLVPNPSFEDTIQCPNGLIQLDRCENWLNFGNSPDYFNGCATNGVNVPNSVFGFQYAHTGVAFAGLIPYRIPTSPNGPNYREFLGIELNQSLQVGQRYFFSYFISCAEQTNVAMASNKLGLKFSTVEYTEIQPPVLNNVAHFYTDSILSDTLSWTKLSGSFIADSSYKYLILGNFFDDQHTDTVSLSQYPDSPYYYIEDVCVSTDSIYNETWTLIDNINSSYNRVWVFPNPTCGQFKLFGELIFEKMEVYSLLGKLVYSEWEINTNKVFNLNFLPSGFYLLIMKNNNRTTVIPIQIVQF